MKSAPSAEAVGTSSTRGRSFAVRPSTYVKSLSISSSVPPPPSPTMCRTSRSLRAMQQGTRQPMEIGYWLSAEEHDPKELVENARRAEQAGFSYVLISDHYHPWISEQGHSPFVWSVIGAIGATTKLGLGTAGTGPPVGIHPPRGPRARS